MGWVFYLVNGIEVVAEDESLALEESELKEDVEDNVLRGVIACGIVVRDDIVIVLECCF